MYVYIYTHIVHMKYICIAQGCDKLQPIGPPNILKLVSGRHFELSGYNHNPLACHVAFQNLLWANLSFCYTLTEPLINRTLKVIERLK